VLADGSKNTKAIRMPCCNTISFRSYKEVGKGPVPVATFFFLVFLSSLCVA